MNIINESKWIPTNQNEYLFMNQNALFVYFFFIYKMYHLILYPTHIPTKPVTQNKKISLSI